MLESKTNVMKIDKFSQLIVHKCLKHASTTSISILKVYASLNHETNIHRKITRFLLIEISTQNKWGPIVWLNEGKKETWDNRFVGK